MNEESISLDDRFWTKVRRGAGQSCWEWIGSRSDFGHGQVRKNRRIYRAHRLMWIATHGRIPDGMCVLHRCDNPPCVRLDHLFLGTKADNTRDMMAKGRARFGGGSGESMATKLTAKLVQQIRSLHAKGGGAVGRGHPNGITQSELARRFGVSQPLIGAIVRREVWRSVP